MCARCAVRAMVLDEFVIAHTLGWWAKALMLRDSAMCVTPSAGAGAWHSHGYTEPSRLHPPARAGYGWDRFCLSYRSFRSRCVHRCKDVRIVLHVNSRTHDASTYSSTGFQTSMSAGGTAGSWMCSSATTLASSEARWAVECAPALGNS